MEADRVTARAHGWIHSELAHRPRALRISSTMPHRLLPALLGQIWHLRLALWPGGRVPVLRALLLLHLVESANVRAADH